MGWARPGLVVLLLLLIVGPARAGAELVLRDGQVLAGLDVKREGAVYKLKLEDGRELSVPAALVREVRLSGDRGDVTMSPEGAAETPAPPTQPGTKTSGPTEVGGGVMTKPPEGVSAGNPLTPFAQWEPKSDWPKEGSDWPKSDWPKAEDPKTIWTPESSLKPDQSNFNPSTWSKQRINPEWTPTDGFAKQGTSMTQTVAGTPPAGGTAPGGTAPGGTAPASGAAPVGGTAATTVVGMPAYGAAVPGLVTAPAPGSALVAAATPAPATGPTSESGRASWYGARYRGKPMANGRPFDPEAFTAAHPSLPFGTLVRVVAADSHQGVIVEITDRMPRRRTRVLLLSEAAARAIGLHELGVADVEVERLSALPPTAAAR